MILGETVILGGAGISCVIIAETEPGASVLCINGATVLEKTANADGKAVFEIKKEGLWTIQASLDGETVETEVLIEHNISEDLSFVDPVLENNSWEVISKVARAGKAREFWNIGDTKPFAYNGTTYNAQIIGFDHDDVTDSASYGRSKAGITFQFKEATSNAFAYHSADTSNDYISTNIYNSVIEMLNSMESTLVSVLVGTDKNYGLRSVATNQKIILPAIIEIMGEYSEITSYQRAEGTQYAFYAAGNSKVKNKNGGSSTDWWTRSKNDGASYAKNSRFCINTSGSYATAGVTVNKSVAPIFFV